MEDFNPNSNKNPKLEQRQLKLKEALTKVERMTDKLGLGVDEGIKETIAVFLAMEIPTCSSCAGHSEEDRNIAPYVQIYTTPQDGWKNDKQKQMEWRQENLKYQQEVRTLLDDFYKNREVANDVRLDICPIGLYGGFNIKNKGAYIPDLVKLPETNKNDAVRIIIKSYQKEFSDFTVFLKGKYLEET